MPLANWDDSPQPRRIRWWTSGNRTVRTRTHSRAINIPLSQMRDRYRELPTDRGVLVYCGVGQRAPSPRDSSRSNSWPGRNLSGGFATHQSVRAAMEGEGSDGLRLWLAGRRERICSRMRATCSGRCRS